MVLIPHGNNMCMLPYMGSRLPSLGHKSPNNMQQRRQRYGKPELQALSEEEHHWTFKNSTGSGEHPFHW